MIKLIASLAFAVLLTACGNPEGSPKAVANQADLMQKVYLAEVSWEGAQDIMIAYNKRPRCTTPRTVITCSSPAAVAEMRKLNREVVAALGTADKLARTPGITEDRVVATLAVANDGVGAVRRIIAAYGN